MLHRKAVVRRIGKFAAIGPLLAVASVTAHAQQTASVSVSANAPLETISATAFGVNTAVVMQNLMDAPVPGLLQGLGATALRYPGGSISDYYHWQTNSYTEGPYGYAATLPADDFDGFMALANKVGAAPIITVNYGSNAAGTAGGDPNEAAAWVAYAKSKSYKVGYWEIGNEVYGNQEYGGDWETDLHASQSPTTYGENVAIFSNAMKAQDPTAKIGAVLTAPGNWPDGVAPDWNSNVLAQCGKSIDFVIVHWYPESVENDANLLAITGQISGMTSGLKSLISQYCGANAPNVKILVTETNSIASVPGKQMIGTVNALFLADDYMTWLEDGATGVSWWDLFNGAYSFDQENNSPSLYGTANYGDFGLLSQGQVYFGGQNPILPPDAPYDPYFGYQMLTHLGKAGDTMVTSTSSNPGMITTHAVKQANGSLALLLINKDPANSYTVTAALSGFMPKVAGTVYTYGENSNAITSAPISVTGSSFSTTVAPYSLTTVVLPASTVSPASPAIVASGTATPEIVAPGTAVKITTGVANAGAALTDSTVTLVASNGNGGVEQERFAGQNFAASDGANPYTWNWIAPQTPGTYDVNLTVTDSTGKDVYAYQTVATVTVANPSPAVDSAFYNFETGTQGFLTTGGLITGISAVTGPVTPFAGARALAVNLNATGAQTAQVYVNAPPVGPTESVVFHLWIPSGSTLKSVTPYVIAGPAGRWLWSETAIAPSPSTTGRWLPIQIPTGVFPAYQLGVQFTTGAGTWNGTCYIDSIYW